LKLSAGPYKFVGIKEIHLTPYSFLYEFTISIPAIFAITTDPFIVFTSNIFAIMGLRALYFLLADMADRFHLLKYGLAILLLFIGVKMLITYWVHVPTYISLSVIGIILTISIVASLFSTRITYDKETK
jgi:tellurite resistance protein TerC